MFNFRSLNIRLKCIDICFQNFSFGNSMPSLCTCIPIQQVADGERGRIFYFQKLGMHQGKKGVCQQYGFQVSLTVVNYSTRQHERCNSDASGETSAVQVCLLLLLSFLSLSYFFHYSITILLSLPLIKIKLCYMNCWF